MPLDVIIVQHAEKERTPGDPGLTALGHEQARACAARLGTVGLIDELWSSSLRRAFETAEHIAAAIDDPAPPIRTDDRIRERINWEGEPHQSRDAFRKDWERSTIDRDFQPAFGDSSRTAGARFAAFLDEVHGRLPEGRVVIVAHGGVTVDLVRTWFGDEHVRDLAVGAIDHGLNACGITRIVIDGCGRRVLSIGAPATVAIRPLDLRM